MFEFNQVLNIEILSICAQKVSNMYISNKKTICVYLNNDTERDTLDQILWIQSRKLFIPHATNDDCYPSEQPILLTTNKSIHNNPEKLVLINLFDKQLLLQSKNAVLIFDNQIENINELREFYLEIKKINRHVEFKQYS